MKLPQILVVHGVSLVTNLAITGLAVTADAPNISPEPLLDSAPTPIVTEPRLPLPGLYSAKPHSSLVYVPRAIDSAALIKPFGALAPEMNVLKPPLQLIPKQLLVK